MLILLSLFASLYAAPEIETPTIARYAIESLDSKRALLFYAALSGASPDTLKALNRDLTRSFGQTGMPRLGLINGEFYVNDEASGARVSSYQPFTITYRRETWTPLPRAPIEMKAASLMKVLRKRTVRLSLMPEAYAEAGTEEIVAIAGALLAAMTENMDDGIKMGVGYGFIASRPGPFGDGKWIASPDFQLECDDEITIFMQSKHRVNVASVIIDNRGMYGYDPRGTKIDLDLRPAEMIEMRKLRACDQDGKAKAFIKTIRQAAEAAQNAIAQTTAPSRKMISN